MQYPVMYDPQRNIGRILLYIAWAAGLALLALLGQSCSAHRPAYRALTPQDEERALKSIEGCLPQDCFSLAVQDRKKGRTMDAAMKLIGLRSRFPGSPWALRSSFMLGVIAVDYRDLPEPPEPNGTGPMGVFAMDPEYLLKEALSLVEIEDYVLLYLGRAHARKKAYKKAVKAYDLLLEKHPESTLRPRARFERAEALYGHGRIRRAIKEFKGFARDFPGDELTPQALLKTAELHMELDGLEKAVEALRELLTEYPANGAAVVAAEMLLSIEALGVDVPGPSTRERYRRAENLFKGTRYEEALRELEALLNAGHSMPGGDKKTYLDPGTILLARTGIRLKRYGLIISTLKQYLEPGPIEKRVEALYWLAVAALRNDDTALVLETEEALAQGFADSIERARVMLFKAELLEKQGEQRQALEIYARVLKEFTGWPSTYARWRLGWAAYKTGGAWKLAEANGLMSTFPESSTPEKYRRRFLYWSGRALEKLNRTEEALRAYARVCGADVSYYCQMAEERRASLGLPYTGSFEPGPPGPANDTAAPQTDGAALTDARYLTAVELLTLGLDEEAATELEVLSKRYAHDREALIKLTALFYKAGDFYRGLRLYHRHIDVISRRPRPSGLEKIAFPLEIVEFIRRVNGPGSTDAYLVAAIMREESTFNPRAISRAGALGLMQIMPKTGEFIAMKTGESPIDRKDLLIPELNVRFGSWYLGHLARRFNNNLVLTIAGYNAGPEAVKRWVEDGPTELDEFIEDIPYPETRTYAKRVIKSYTEYLRSGGLDPSKRFIRPIVRIDKARGASGGKGGV